MWEKKHTVLMSSIIVAFIAYRWYEIEEIWQIWTENGCYCLVIIFLDFKILCAKLLIQQCSHSSTRWQHPCLKITREGGVWGGF